GADRNTYGRSRDLGGWGNLRRDAERGGEDSDGGRARYGGDQRGNPSARVGPVRRRDARAVRAEGQAAARRAVPGGAAERRTQPAPCRPRAPVFSVRGTARGTPSPAGTVRAGTGG